MKITDVLVEFAPGGGGSGDYLRALASAWYNGVFNTGSLPKGIKTQEDVERLLNRGIVCPDGKTRKLHIDYNSDFDGVEIYSDDYYEHGDESGELDSRTGQPWGPYDHMEFRDEELDEGVAEATPQDGKSWMATIRQQHPDVKFIQAKMPGAPIIALVNGKPVAQFDTKKSVEEDGALDKFRSRIGTQGNIQRQNQRQQDWLDAHHQSSLDRMTNHRDAMNRLSNAGVDDTIARQEIRRERMKKDDDDWDKTFDVMRDRLNRYQWSSQKGNAEQGVAEGALNEFAPDSNDGDQEDVLHKYAKMWWAGDEATQMQIERALARMGWEIGEDEGSYDNGGVFVVRAGDVNGDSYVSWAAEDLTEGEVTKTSTGIVHKATDKYGADDVPFNHHYAKDARDLDTVNKQQVKDLDSSMGITWRNRGTKGVEVDEGDLNEKSTSQAQFRTMAAAAHNPEFARKVGIKQSVAREFNKADKGQDYKDLPVKAAESKQAPAEKEADYGPAYQDMVQRVKKLAGLGPLKTQYDPAKRVYRNMPTAVQPKK